MRGGGTCEQVYYGHGNQHLSTVLAVLMRLQFLIDQVQEVACPLFKAARGAFSFTDTIVGCYTQPFFRAFIA